MFELQNAAFDEGLFVLGRLILRILDQLTILHGFVKSFGNFLALHVAQMLELLLEFLAALGG